MHDTKEEKFIHWKSIVRQPKPQKNKDGKLVIPYATDPVQQGRVYPAGAGQRVCGRETGYDHRQRVHQPDGNEMRSTYNSVDSDIIDNIIDKQEGGDSVLSKEEETKLKDLFTLQVPDLHVSVEVKGLSAEAPPWWPPARIHAPDEGDGGDAGR